MFAASLWFLSTVVAQDVPNTQMGGAELAHRMQAEVPLRRIDLAECYRSNVLRLGSRNSEGADTLLRGVRVMCQSIIDRLYVLYVPEIQGASISRQAVEQDIRKAEDSAIASLLEARSARQ